MAISTGVGRHWAWLNVSGAQFLVQHGTVEQQAKRSSSAFNATIPLNLAGAEALFSTIPGGTNASIIVSTRNATNQLITGEIDSVEIDYVAGIISVGGRDASAKLHDMKSSDKWTNKKGHEVVQDLAGRAGMSVKVDPSIAMAGKQTQQDYVKSSDGVSFSYVIHKLAEKDGARWFVDNKGMLNYLSLNNPQGFYPLMYVRQTPDSPMSADFMKLTIKRNLQAGKNIKSTVKSWHPKKKQVFQSTATVGGEGGDAAYNYHGPNLLQDDTKAHSKAMANEQARHEITVDADVVGDPSINVAMSLVLAGTGFFDQAYQMDSIHHEFGIGGHRMTINAKSAKQGREASSE